MTPLISFFCVKLSHLTEAAPALLGENFGGILNSYCYNAHNWVDVAQRQLYWFRECKPHNLYQISKSMTDIHARMLAKPAFVVTRIKKNDIRDLSRACWINLKTLLGKTFRLFGNPKVPGLGVIQGKNSGTFSLNIGELTRWESVKPYTRSAVRLISPPNGFIPSVKPRVFTPTFEINLKIIFWQDSAPKFFKLACGDEARGNGQRIGG